MIKILFVCHGNICRSTLAESVFTHKVKCLGLADQFVIDSFATSREEIGKEQLSAAFSVDENFFTNVKISFILFHTADNSAESICFLHEKISYRSINSIQSKTVH